jgi:hypothetical protein
VTTTPASDAPARTASAARMPGLLLAFVIACVYGGIALSVDFPRAAMGFQSDEATYYLMGHSLARDADLVYRAEDLRRVWREFPSGPSGVFLKRGSVPSLRVDVRIPFVHLRGSPDPDTSRYYYGKSYMYPLVAAPFVALLGTNGFLLLNAILLAAFALAAWLFLATRVPEPLAAMLAGAFVGASVAPVYFVWITPELFNLTTVAVAYLCWTYKEAAGPAAAPRGAGWLFRPGSDLAATAFIAAATCSKPSNAMLLAPILVLFAWRRQWRRALVCGVLFAALLAVFFGVEIAMNSGDWNFQGGEDRRTCYGAYPLQSADAGLNVCLERETNKPVWGDILGPYFWTVLFHNVAYFFIGRHSGLVPYFFPAVLALAAFLARLRSRPLWQWLVFAAAAGQILLFVVGIPYNYFGGGGVVGNRYFMSAYGLFVFLIPGVRTWPPVVLAWIVGALFSAQLVLNPFFHSFNPAAAAKHGPLRLLPVELTLVNTLPITTQESRVRRLFGAEPRFQVYFLDDNAYDPEGDSFWVRGDARAEILVKTDTQPRMFAATLEAGPVETDVTIRIAGRSKSVVVHPGEIQRVTVTLDEGFPYMGTRVWHASISSGSGFVPMFVNGGTDNRFLGVRVKPELVP